MSDSKTLKFNLSRVGTYIGAMWGVNLLLLALLATFFGIGGSIVASLGVFYIGYSATLAGSIIGLILGFLHGYVVGVIGNVLIHFLMK